MTGRFASLGMYDQPAVQWANDRIWAALAMRLTAAGVVGVPATLDRSRSPAALWDDSGLLLGQSCGYPFRTAYRDRLRYVATPSYDVPGCVGGDYRSRFVVRADDAADALSALHGRRAAINDRCSNSGMNMFRAAVAPLAGRRPFFSAVVETGSHAASIRAVVDGDADVAAIDTISFAHMQRYEPDAMSGVRTIGWSAAAAGLPFVTAAGTSDGEVAILRTALHDVLSDPETASARDALFLADVATVPIGAYDAIVALERQAIRLGYPVLE